ncbi:MAG: SPOR domain-containing protein [Cyclobacteriaceae bacterium]
MKRLILEKLLAVFLLVGYLFLHQACAPKASKSASGDYTEDLSGYRPITPTFELPEKADTKGSKETNREPVTPSNDVTRQINYYLDTLANGSIENWMEVYSIQIYSGGNREEGNKARQKVYQILPDANPQLIYMPPNYRVRIGRYADRLEANPHLIKLKRDFPAALLVPERVKIK